MMFPRGAAAPSPLYLPSGRCAGAFSAYKSPSLVAIMIRPNRTSTDTPRLLAHSCRYSLWSGVKSESSTSIMAKIKGRYRTPTFSVAPFWASSVPHQTATPPASHSGRMREASRKLAVLYLPLSNTRKAQRLRCVSDSMQRFLYERSTRIPTAQKRRFT